MPILITEDIFQAFLKCETKSFLKFKGAAGAKAESGFGDWQRQRVEDFKGRCATQLRAQFREDECLIGAPLPRVLENSKYRLALDCLAHTQEVQSRVHALERVISCGKTKHSPYIPIRFAPAEKITKHDKLLLAFDALALSLASGKLPPSGKIIHGGGQKSVNVQLTGLMKMTRSVVERIAAQQESPTPPPLILNRHCAECEFQARCRQVAVEKDELSLLSGMTERERKKQHEKGIFTVTQLSYTFRPRRRPKRLASRPEKHYHELKALALRERKIHIAGRPELNITGTPVYLDVEGVPDRDFYYLIGLHIKSGDSDVQHSFWADDASEEREIWTSLLRALAKIESPRLIHYGSYETVFLKRMKERYGEAADDSVPVDQLIAGSVNILSVIYAQIYFPTYSNGLKEIAQYLGFQWSESGASGLKALRWRSEWELSRDTDLKQKLITYNADDCEALARVTDSIARLCERQARAVGSQDGDTVHVDSLKRLDLQRFGNKEFSMPELKHINQAAYWDYQRERVYVRLSKRLKRVSRTSAKGCAKALPINKVIEYPPPNYCPQCQASTIRKQNTMSKVVRDLKFGRVSVKRWVVKYLYYRFVCSRCEATFSTRPSHLTGHKIGPNVIAYMIYQLIELLLPNESVARSLKQLFGLNLKQVDIHREKSRASQRYEETYQRIIGKIVTGRLLHADETKASIKGKSAYVWVFTNLEEVAFYYTETREGDFLQELLRNFHGVLVSDFYAAYDSIDCPQQKCLIHLMRDLNDDLLKYPFNEELKELVREFAMLLKPVIETVDRFGLKAHFLRKHKVFVERFFRRLSKRDYQSEIAVKYKKRFDKNRDKLFTFLDYDGVPWNNNNAEHAIKAFARLRQGVRGSSTEKGIREYLTFLSISETCKYKGVSFLEFLRSGGKDLDEFINPTLQNITPKQH